MWHRCRSLRHVSHALRDHGCRLRWPNPGLWNGGRCDTYHKTARSHVGWRTFGSSAGMEADATLKLRSKVVADARLKVSVSCITDVRCVDAIVTCANEHLVGTQLPYINLDGSGGCVFDCTDKAIHKLAGPRLKEACQALPVVEESDDSRWGGIRCPEREARLTGAFDLPHCAYVIHVVGPPWPSSAEELHEAYQACIGAALQGGGPESPIRSIATPAISSGVQQWPRDMSWAAAIEVLGGHLVETELARLTGQQRSAGSCVEPVSSTVGITTSRSLERVVLAAFDAASGEEASECLRRWVDGTLTQDGLF
eukprot:TRINITY_DN67062_c0_g1_i1.p1 TRINITY_DN67062_c0_g1~~TRINITY_DN67062_c0_g1_i1.p1  ORF type:complete len:311 (-),score=31.35 TRINITY_DN67062_c0_g1_i1:114-1046(-)